ncbi:MAG: hypothetical protein QOD28_2171 [Acidobacteriota bacterium]|nr:hypothetical protein [Acidobacteriota bacterium]
MLALGGAFGFATMRVSAQPDELEEAKRLNRQVLALYEAGRYDEAVPLAERALAIREKAFGAQHLAVAQSLNSLAILYEAKSDYARAEPLYERALAIREKLMGAEHPEVASALNNLAGLNYVRGDYARAEPLYQRALAIREKTLGAEHPGIAAPLNNLALLYHVKGDYARAEPLYKRALAIREKALSAEHPDLATSLSNLGGLYDSTGDYARAEPLYKRALAIYEKVLGAAHPQVATSLDNLAGLYRTKGDYASAEPLYQRALAINEKTFGAEHPEVATSLNNMAGLYFEKGDYGRAELLHQRALAIYEKSLGAEHPQVATSLGNLALIYETKGDYARAETLYQRALAIREKTLGAEHPEVALTLNNLALLYQVKGDDARAEPLYRRALAIREKVLGAEHPAVAISLQSLAVMYHTQGDYARAEPLYKRALAISEKALGAEHPDFAQALYNFAGMYHDSGDYARAEPLQQRALAIREKAFGAEHPTVASSLSTAASLYEAKGDYERAVSGMTRAADIREQNLTLILNTGSEKQKQLYLDTLSGETDAILSLNIKGAPKNGAATRLALTTILRRKGRALDAMTDQIAALRRRAAPEDQKLLDQLAAARAQLANLQLGASNKLTPAERQTQLSALAEEIEKLEAAISRRSAEFRAQAQSVTLSNVQAALPADAALIEIFSYRPYDTKAQPGSKYGTSRYVAYVARREGEPQFVDLGEAAAIESNVEKLRRTLRDSRQAARGDVAAVKSAARVVDEQVMRPVRALLGATRRVFLSPDGALNLIPFAALVDERGKYLVEDYTLTYLTSGRDLLRLQTTGESKAPPLVLANPLYNDSGGNSQVETLAGVTAKRDVDFNAIDFSKVSYVPLPGTADEARALSALMPGARLLSAAEATEAALKQIHAPRLLHVATHGFFLTDKPAQADARGLGLSSTAPVPSRSENLLLRSGLILAGVNQRQSGTGEDGVLTAAEAAALDLWGTKLVVLSACETGLGDVKNGDGVYGLRRALVLAGSESQVMSLWQVSDAATRDLMKAYYTRLQRGEGRTEALRQVQLEMLKGATKVQDGAQERTLLGAVVGKAQAVNYSHPYYWASFIQSGAWSGVENNPAGVKGQ